jgi:2-polyprenyl-3-methyl-5-hydroxy-6-metoxy-1,4-benzoquinol methylase
MYLTKQQINTFVKTVGQPKASVLLNKFFNSYRSYLDSSDVADLYDDDYIAKINSHPAYLWVEEKYKINIYNKYSYEYLLSKLTPQSSVLDIGCGNGDFALAIAAQGQILSIVGIDFSEEFIRQANHKLIGTNFPCRFFCGDVGTFQSQDLFDFIVFNDVTEHLSDRELKRLFNTLDALLAMNGEVIIHTPNGLALNNDTDSNIFQRFYKAYLARFCGWQGFERTLEQLYYDQAHINIKSYRQLRTFLNGYGYSTRVIYDDHRRNFLKCQLSPNMLVIARKKNYIG